MADASPMSDRPAAVSVSAPAPSPAPLPLPLFYRSVVPLDRARHRSLALPAVASYRYAATSHLVPAVVDEFAVACAHLPILFAPDAEGMSPVFLTGMGPGRNGFVADDGAWTGGYVPAYLRRHPFILGEMPGAEPLLCIDEQADGLQQDPAVPPPANGGDASAAPAPPTAVAAGALRLFNADGTDAPALADTLRLAADYALAAQRTQLFCRLLVELKLLQPITVQRGEVSGGAGADQPARPGSVIHGLLAVSEPALAALPDASFLRLRGEGHLGAVYTHLVSLRAIERMPE